MAYIIAHRGASHAAPENSLSAIRLAWDEGADGIEGDFMLTSDGQIVCCHDVDTRRVAGEGLIVRQTRLADLQQLDVGRWKGNQWQGERIPSLDEVLAAVPGGKRIVVELKDGPEIVQPLAESLGRSAFAAENVLIISLVDATIAECGRQLPHVRRHWLSGYERDPDGAWRPSAEEVITAVRGVGADGFGSQALVEHFDAEFVGALRGAGFGEFHVWTVDDPQVARFYEGLGAWGITTNRPGFIRQELGK